MRFNEFAYTRPQAGLFQDDKFVMLSNGLTSTASLADLETKLVARTTLQSLITNKMETTGGTVTGDISISKTTPALILNSPVAGTSQLIQFQDNSVNRWAIFKDGVGGGLIFRRYDVSGNFLDNPMIIDDDTGYVSFTDASAVHVPVPTVSTNAATKLYVDTADALKANLNGATFTGLVRIGANFNSLTLGHTSTTGQPVRTNYNDGSVLRYSLEKGADNSFSLSQYDASGVFQRNIIHVAVTTGIATFVAPVIVPTPTLSTHATTKTYVDTADALKVNKAGDTLTGNLTGTRFTASTASPQIVLDETDQAADARKWRLVSANGIFTLTALNDAETVAQMTPIAVNRANGGMALGGPGSNIAYVHVPAVTGTSQPAQVTAYDANTGRLAIAGVEMGSTGWRTISSWDAAGVVTGAALSASWTPRSGNSGYIRMKRTGDTVFVEIVNLQTAVAMSAGVTYEVLASGLPTTGFLLIGEYSSIIRTGIALSASWSSSNGPFIVSPFTALGLGNVAFNGNNTIFKFAAAPGTWPTSLPGTESTPPFTG